MIVLLTYFRISGWGSYPTLRREGQEYAVDATRVAQQLSCGWRNNGEFSAENTWRITMILYDWWSLITMFWWNRWNSAELRVLQFGATKHKLNSLSFLNGKPEKNPGGIAQLCALVNQDGGHECHMAPISPLSCCVFSWTAVKFDEHGAGAAETRSIYSGLEATKVRVDKFEMITADENERGMMIMMGYGLNPMVLWA